MPSFLGPDGRSFMQTPTVTATPATGNTIRVTAGRTYIAQTGVLAALTVLMPSKPGPQSLVELVPQNTITALTIQTDSGGAIAGAPTAGVANTAIYMLWNGTNWVRKQ